MRKNIVPDPQFYLDALQNQPDHAEHWFSLGLVYWRQDHYEQAISAFRQALECDASVLDAYVCLGLVLEHQQKWNQAKQTYLSFLKRTASSVERLKVTVYLARINIKQGFYPQAFKLVLEVLTVQPGNRMALNHLGYIYMAQNHFESALVCFNGVLQQTTEAQGLALVAEVPQNEVLTVLQAYQEALTFNPEQLRSFLQIEQDASVSHGLMFRELGYSPEYLNALTKKADILLKMRCFEQVYHLIQPVLSTQYINLGLLASYCQAGLFLQKHDEVEKHILSLLEGQSVALKYRPFYYQLGEIYDKKGNYEKAFANYTQGNVLKRRRFNADTYRATIDHLVEIFEPELITPLLEMSQDCSESSDATNPQPIFIFGMPRSGSTLIEQILASHPQVYGGGELRFMGNLWHKLNLEMNSTPETWRAYLKKLNPTMINELSQAYLSQLAEVRGVNVGQHRFVTDKMPANIYHLPLMAVLFPNARFIHAYRDPLDTCWSCFKQDFFNLDFANDLHDLGAYYAGYQKLVKHWFPHLSVPILNIAYENLVLEQEKISRDIIQFCGLDWDPVCLSFYLNERQVYTASYQQVHRPIYTSSVGSSKNYLNYLQPLLAYFDPASQIKLKD